MSKTAKIAISLPEELLQRIDKESLASGETRSQFFRHAAEAFLRHQREQELDKQYVRGYLEDPETSEEVAGFYIASLVALAQDPWDSGDQ